MAQDQTIATTTPAAADGADPAKVVVAARDITRTYGEGDAAVQALRGVSVDFPRGQFAAVMGPSGSGKSTLMHILAGLDQPTTGSVKLDGTEIVGLSDHQLTLLRREKIGFIFQFFNLLPMLTMEENIDLPLAIAGTKGDREWRQRLIEAVGLTRRLKHKPAELSGGEQQRVAVARALLTRPAVVFGDEPTGNLDSKTSAQILDLLRQAKDDYGQTIIMVTHDARSASSADRILFLSDGQIVADRGSMTAAEILDTIKGLE